MHARSLPHQFVSEHRCSIKHYQISFLILVFVRFSRISLPLRIFAFDPTYPFGSSFNGYLLAERFYPPINRKSSVILANEGRLIVNFLDNQVFDLNKFIAFSHLWHSVIRFKARSDIKKKSANEPSPPRLYAARTAGSVGNYRPACRHRRPQAVCQRR
ncbi:protein of unknown function [Paraburkholderia kururiensis]